jgi:cell division protein FtsB
MAYRNIEPVSKQITIVVGLTVVGFMAFGLALSFYRNTLFEERLSEIDQRNEGLRDGIEEDKRQLEYYRSTQYKDKYAKEQLGMVNPGEKVLVITQENADRTGPLETDTAAASDQEEAAYFEMLRQMPVLEHWKLYLFRREDMRKLRQNFLREES